MRAVRLAACMVGATLVVAMLMLVMFTLLTTVQRYVQHGSPWADDVPPVPVTHHSLSGEALPPRAKSTA